MLAGFSAVLLAVSSQIALTQYANTTITNDSQYDNSTDDVITTAAPMTVNTTTAPMTVNTTTAPMTFNTTTAITTTTMITATLTAANITTTSSSIDSTSSTAQADVQWACQASSGTGQACGAYRDGLSRSALKDGDEVCMGPSEAWGAPCYPLNQDGSCNADWTPCSVKKMEPVVPNSVCSCQDYRNGLSQSALSRGEKMCMGPSEAWGTPCYPLNHDGSCNADWTLCGSSKSSMEPPQTTSSASTANTTTTTTSAPNATTTTSTTANTTATTSSAANTTTTTTTTSSTNATDMIVGIFTTPAIPTSLTIEITMTLENASDFVADSYLQSVAATAGVHVDLVKVESVEYIVTSTYLFPAGASINENQCVNAVAAASEVVEAGAVTCQVAPPQRRLAFLSGNRRLLEAVPVTVIIRATDPEIAQQAQEAATNTAAISSRLSKAIGTSIEEIKISSAPSVGVKVTTTITSATGQAVSAPSVATLKSEYESRTGKSVLIKMSVVELTSVTTTTTMPFAAKIEDASSSALTMSLCSKVVASVAILTVMPLWSNRA